MSENSLDEQLLQENNRFNEEVEYIGFWPRLAAALIDTLVLAPIFAFSFYNIFNLKSLVLMYGLTLLSVLYKPLLEWKRGATIGKSAIGIKVVDYNLEKMNLDQSMTRYIPWLINSIFSLFSSTYLFMSPKFNQMDGFIEMGEITNTSPIQTASSIYSVIFLIIVGRLIFDSKGQGFHDLFAKTYCIKGKTW